MPKSIYVQHLAEQPNSNPHYLNRLVKLLNHFIFIEPPKKPKGYENHHIVPKAKSWKPEWEFEKNNLLKVPVKAHYVIHHLMWKAFPKNYAMIKAFHETSNRQQKQKITSKVFEVLKLEVSKVQSQNNLKRVADGTHPWLDGKVQSKSAKKRVLKQLNDGTHHFLGGEIQKKNSLKRVANGTHHFLGGEIQKKRVANGAHNFLGGEIQKKSNAERLENGTHSFQIKKTCPYCSKTCSIALYGRWHGDRCKSLLEK